MKKIVITFIFAITVVLSVFSATYGLSIAGGGSYVFQSMGYLDAVMNKGFFPDQIVGTSMGSVVAYYMADGFYPSQVYKMFSILDFSKFFEMSFPVNGGIVNTAAFGDLLYYTTKIDSFDKFMVPVKFGTVNLNKFDSEYINKGDPIRAVRAAVAIEGLFEPLKIGNCYYADIGIRDVNVVYPKSQFTTEKTVSIRFDSPKPDFTGMNFSNIINVLYTSVRMGSYVSNSLYASDKLDYDVSWILAEPAFDLKFFTNGIDLYKTGNDLGLKYLKDNPKFFENNKLTKKTVQTKVIDVYDVYAKVSNESYYRPREFYSTLRMNPGTGRDWHVLDSYIYAEIMNSRFYGGIKWDLFTMKLYPYIRMKQYYLPFESNRLDIQMVMEDYFSTVLRTYIMEGFRRNIYIDASYKFDFVQRKNMFEAAIGYDGMFKT
ncbi:MAG TPA: patatin-like phospholipase family protein, partial [Petrotogaceae bacterium]|nr:patatin-like phospholipase family protein [Petrotogaceae bacterium]